MNEEEDVVGCRTCRFYKRKVIKNKFKTLAGEKRNLVQEACVCPSIMRTYRGYDQRELAPSETNKDCCCIWHSRKPKLRKLRVSRRGLYEGKIFYRTI